eukprot:6200919-Pleurochrysis_carterae.AAC.2
MSHWRVGRQRATCVTKPPSPCCSTSVKRKLLFQSIPSLTCARSSKLQNKKLGRIRRLLFHIRCTARFIPRSLRSRRCSVTSFLASLLVMTRPVCFSASAEACATSCATRVISRVSTSWVGARTGVSSDGRETERLCVLRGRG